MLISARCACRLERLCSLQGVLLRQACRDDHLPVRLLLLLLLLPACLPALTHNCLQVRLLL